MTLYKTIMFQFEVSELDQTGYSVPTYRLGEEKSGIPNLQRGKESTLYPTDNLISSQLINVFVLIISHNFICSNAMSFEGSANMEGEIGKSMKNCSLQSSNGVFEHYDNKNN